MFHNHPWLVALFCTCCFVILLENRNQLGALFTQMKCYVMVLLQNLTKRG